MSFVISLLILISSLQSVTCWFWWWAPTTTSKPRIWTATAEGPPRNNRSYLLRDYLGEHEKGNLDHLMNDLVQDAKLKMRQLTGVREIHELTVGFNVGLLIGKIRERYRMMLEIYRQAQDFRHERWHFLPPGIFGRFLEHYLHFQEFIHIHEIAIDQMIHVLESIPAVDLEGGNEYVNAIVKALPRPNAQSFSRRHRLLGKMGPQISNKQKEEFLRQRIDMPTEMTPPQNRFFNRWPVVKSWSENFDKM